MSIAFGGALLPQVEAVTLVVVLLTACVMDLRTRRIPNGLVVVGALAGVGFALLDGGLGGGVHAVAGLTVGLLVWLPFWLLRMLTVRVEAIEEAPSAVLSKRGGDDRDREKSFRGPRPAGRFGSGRGGGRGDDREEFRARGRDEMDMSMGIEE